MTVDAKMAILAILIKFAQKKMIKREMICAKTKSVDPMLFAIWGNACVHQDLREMILTMLMWDVLLYPNVFIILIVDTTKYVLCCPIQYINNV